MSSIWIAFLTGLTTGGLSCLAVQSGLLASTLAHEVEKQVSRKKVLEALVTFLSAKLAAYTLLGFLLGWLGTMLQLTPHMRAAFQIAVGVFMVGMALRMLDAHPVFRWFVINPPRFLTRFIRRYAKQSEGDLVAAGFLGVITVFIPCGITQAMMAAALTTGSAVTGAMLLFAFTLGTTPVFFALSYLATTLGERLHQRFTKVAAVLVLVLGLVSLEGGLNLAGSPISFVQFLALVRSKHSTSIAEVSPSPSTAVADNTVTITADRSGYSPGMVKARAGKPLTLIVTSKDLYTCAMGLVIPKLGLQQQLPSNGITTIQIPAQPAGPLAYTCSMGMYRGTIQID